MKTTSALNGWTAKGIRRALRRGHIHRKGKKVKIGHALRWTMQRVLAELVSA